MSVLASIEQASVHCSQTPPTWNIIQIRENKQTNLLGKLQSINDISFGLSES